jgi:phosphotransferase system IIA component
MNGEGFTTFVKEGDKVKAGDKLIHFNRAAIKEAGYSDMVVVLVTNSFEYDEVKAL